ncbi:MAG TPA: response regulator transcription factor [Bryobacteraceae bacterium]|nr:response regulator transcription factor [Bryobacteraceae bacterium]
MESQGAILLAEDDTELCSMMADFFAHRGFEVEVVHNGRDAIRRSMEGSHDLLILDVMMPVLDGFEALRQIRKRSALPVIMLTARTAPADRIEGLNTGADDYLPKPFAPEELLARVRAVLRRSGRAPQSGETLECGSLRVRPATREVWVRSEAVALTSIEFDILECLAHAAGRVVSRDSLTAALYQREASPFERSLDVHVSHLRRKLDDEDETFIHTVRGAGYMLASRRRASENPR